MINTLFSMHNIKYIISVDDCFFARKREDIEATIYSEMCTSLEPFRAILSSCNQTEIVDAIDEMMAVGADSTTLIQTLLGNLEEVDLLKCFDICEKKGATYAEERDIILAFLEGLKSEGQIIEYRTFSSTTEANLFDIKEAGMTDGAILWLLDRNFSRVDESEEAGLKFAENILKRENASQNYIYILSAVEPATGLTEDGIEEEFDKVLAANCLPDTHSFIYFISKRRLQTKDNTKIARSLSQGFKRKACFELFQLFNSCLCDGVSTASSKVQRIRQKTLNYLFANKASVRGESYIEVAARLVQIFHQDEYNKAIAEQHSLIAEKAHYYEKLCAAITETVGNEQALTSTLKEYRDIELYAPSTQIVITEAIRVLHTVEASRDAILTQMQALAKTLPEYSLVREMPCIGDTLAPRLIAEIGDVRRFHSKRALIAYAGIDAPPYQSGKFCANNRHISKRGNRYLRKTGYEVMQSYVMHKPANDPIFTFIEKKRGEGKSGKLAMVAGLNKFLRVYYGKVTELYRSLPTIE